MEESDSEKKMEKENVGPRMDPPIGEPEGSLGWVLPNTAMKKKVLLMGKSGSGKTSMRSIIFANYIARDTRRLGATRTERRIGACEGGSAREVVGVTSEAERREFFEKCSQQCHTVEVLDRLHSLQINSSLSTYSLVDSVGNTKTFDVEHSHVRFLGNLVLNLWDCGGQDNFMENYFTSQRDNIFRNVEVLIYVFDVESRELEKDMHYYQSCLEAILQNSPDAKIFCLVHKMDLVQEDQRDLIFKEREEDLRRLSRPLECSCFRTSIWDETLYKAWSSIVYQLIPNVQQLEMNLRNFAEIIEADEVLLFERATFLVISHYQCKEQRDAHRFEKISNIIKQFKLSCSKLAASFQSMEVRNSNFAAFIDIFTSNTYVMVVMSDPSIPSAATLINIRNARKHFEKLERVDGPKQCLLMR
ncbi:ras-related GTP-binding protein B isoform X1 [Phyllostomus hastatus]|uniref:ras-related GTP-binding protein B isoform X1 n=2 Tax=Phyllostomus hastatus TaxID=9423 RepID=UPI001E6807E9|nr:ras-related GTP-binding protein B isoform X1 [Phyllostomus hastatus]